MALKYFIKPMSRIRLETVYQILSACKTPTSGYFIREEHDTKWSIIEGYIRFMLQKKFIRPVWEIERGLRICKYFTTPKGIELLSMLQNVYDILSIM
ncbi:hypothetical protein ES702_04497 [subsurface metagenome]